MRVWSESEEYESGDGVGEMLESGECEWGSEKGGNVRN